jgi:UDP-glucose 4-epimerase
MKIIITGACGHIGSFLVQNISKIKKVKKTILIDSMKTNKFNSLFKLAKGPNFNFYQKDLSITNSLSSFKNIDIIIHCASMTDAANSFDIKKQMYKNNLGCMKTVIDYCIKNKTKLVHISTTSVYGKQANVVSENDNHLLKPQSPYADIKLIEEKLLFKNTKKIKFSSFRF